MDWVLVGAMVFAAWAAVSVLGAERQRRLDLIEADAKAAALAAAMLADAATH